jgi:RNA polymerase sigma-70 factor (ECF subfamily)
MMMGPDLLGRLLDAHAAALALYARQWCAAPEDAVQEAFLRLAARSDVPPDPVGWLFAVTRNLARTAGRSERRRRQHEAVAAARHPGWFMPAEGTGLDAESAATALTGLPAEEREAVVARIWGGLSFEQIGGLIGTSAATAHRRFTAGLALLRERLGVTCPSSPSTPTLPP